MTFDNPFEQNTPAPVEQPAPEQPYVEAEKWQAAAGSSDAVSVTLKAGTGFDAPWIVVKGANASEVRSQLQDIAQSKLMELAASASKAWQSVAGGGAPSAPPQRKASNGWQGQQQAAPVASQQLHPTGESCQHGTLVYDTWNAKGRDYAAYKCPVKKANYRDPNACDRLVWADKVQQSGPATPPF